MSRGFGLGMSALYHFSREDNAAIGPPGLLSVISERHIEIVRLGDLPLN
jgi:hypothetical protein